MLDLIVSLVEFFRDNGVGDVTRAVDVAKVTIWWNNKFEGEKVSFSSARMANCWFWNKQDSIHWEAAIEAAVQ